MHDHVKVPNNPTRDHAESRVRALIEGVLKDPSLLKAEVVERVSNTLRGEHYEFTCVRLGAYTKTHRYVYLTIALPTGYGNMCPTITVYVSL